MATFHSAEFISVCPSHRTDCQAQPAGVFPAEFFDESASHPVALMVVNQFGSVHVQSPQLVFQRFAGTDINTLRTGIRAFAFCKRPSIFKDFINQNRRQPYTGTVRFVMITSFLPNQPIPACAAAVLKENRARSSVSFSWATGGIQYFA